MKANRKILEGSVVSDKMNKTIVVEIKTATMHPQYKKYVRKSTKYKAHDENQEAHMGDVVRIVESKPYSKEKKWKLVKIVSVNPIKEGLQ